MACFMEYLIKFPDNNINLFSLREVIILTSYNLFFQNKALNIFLNCVRRLKVSQVVIGFSSYITTWSRIFYLTHPCHRQSAIRGSL